MKEKKLGLEIDFHVRVGINGWFIFIFGVFATALGGIVDVHLRNHWVMQGGIVTMFFGLVGMLFGWIKEKMHIRDAKKSIKENI